MVSSQKKKVKKKSVSKAPRKKKGSENSSIVITGVSGFIGRNLLKYLEKSNQFKKVIAIDRKKPNMTLKKTKFYRLDLTETMADVSLAEILKKEKCETLIHTAFPISPMRNESKAHEIIAIGSFYVFNACAAAKVRKVIMASTTDVYGAFATNPNYLTEDHPRKGFLQSRLLADKIDAEKQALKFQRKDPKRVVTVIRHATIMGPTIESFKTKYFSRAAAMTMLGFDPLIQFVHEEDVINAFIKCINEDHPGFFNLSGDGVLPLSRVIEICGAVNLRLTQIGFKAFVQAMWYADLSPAPASYVDFLRYLCIVDNSKIKKEMKFFPRHTTKEALLSFVEEKRLKEMNLQEKTTV